MAKKQKPKPPTQVEQMQAGWICPECKLERKEFAGPDPCLGMLPGVKYACCNHGGKGAGYTGYVYFENGVSIRFKELVLIEKRLENGDWESIHRTYGEFK